jgi:hypothetical protein
MVFILPLMARWQNKDVSGKTLSGYWGTTVMKMAISFIAGILVCCLMLFGVKMVMPVRADVTEDTAAVADNSTTNGLLNLLPDIEKIYRESLTMPFIKARSKIYDPDIAQFYQELLDKTVLYDPTKDQTASGSDNTSQ